MHLKGNHWKNTLIVYVFLTECKGANQPKPTPQKSKQAKKQAGKPASRKPATSNQQLKKPTESTLTSTTSTKSTTNTTHTHNKQKHTHKHQHDNYHDHDRDDDRTDNARNSQQIICQQCSAGASIRKGGATMRVPGDTHGPNQPAVDVRKFPLK